MAKAKTIKKVAIVGAGTMGLGIAQISVLAGFETVLYDISEQQLKKAEGLVAANLDKGIEKGKLTKEQRDAALKQLTFSNKFDSLKADIVIEAIVEDLNVKRDLFTKLAELNGPEAILATNTSSIPITRIATTTPQPERVVGLHFFNPAHIMKLVEVISGAATAETVAATAAAFAEKLGKKAVRAKDAPGFIVNRVARNFYVEGLKVLEEKVASLEDIDELVQASGFPMGPFRLMDLIGVDTNFSVTSSMFESFHYEAKFRPSHIQQQKVDAGHHGRKSGKGFYNYEK